jgi:hypothetical protein
VLGSISMEFKGAGKAAVVYKIEEVRLALRATM